MRDKVGVIPPPPGETADFDYSNPWRLRENMTLIGVGLSLCTPFLVMRVYTKVQL